MALQNEAAVEILDDARRVAGVLSPARRRILSEIRVPESASTLARRLHLPRQKVNYHLRELERLGFLELAEERRRRGCIERYMRPTARFYLISPALLEGISRERDPVPDRFSSAYLIAAAARIIRDVAALRARAARARKTLATVTLQSDVRFRSPADRSAFFEELAEQFARLAARYHDDSPGSRSFRFVVAGHPVITRSRDMIEEMP